MPDREVVLSGLRLDGPSHSGSSLCAAESRIDLLDEHEWPISFPSPPAPGRETAATSALGGWPLWLVDGRA